jgi:hypothetical protein
MSKAAWIILGLVGGGILLSKASAAPAPRLPHAAAPASYGSIPAKMAYVGAKEKVSASTYAVIRNQRPGYFYVAAKRKGSELEFTSPVAGYFTRVVFQDAAGRLFAEILKA